LHLYLRTHGYPSGFRVLCHNCNFSFGHYGYCPHQAAAQAIARMEKYK
jgi:hypothetical protein